MSEVSGLGNLIEIRPGEKSFSTIEAARKAAEGRSGNEAIVRNEDGSYSLFEIAESKDQEANVVAMAEKNNIAQFDPKVVEFSISGMIWDKTIRVENQAKELKDVQGVGSKIGAAYLDNNKGKNLFNTEEEAIAAAKKHEGIEAVVKNSDGTFSLYRATQEQMDKIMNDPDYNGKVVKFVMPKSAFFGLSSSELVVDVKKSSSSAASGTAPAVTNPPNGTEQPSGTSPSVGTEQPGGSAPAVTDPAVSVPTSEKKYEELSIDKLKGLDVSKYNSIFTGDLQYVGRMLDKLKQDPDFKNKLEALLNDSRVSDEVKQRANEGVKALNQIVSAIDAGKSPEELKELLNSKSGSERLADLAIGASFMAKYHSENKYDSSKPTLDQLNQTRKDVEKDLGPGVSKKEIFAEVNKRLGLTGTSSINFTEYLDNSNKKSDELKGINSEFSLDEDLLNFISDDISFFDDVGKGSEKLKELEGIFAKIKNKGNVSDSEIGKVRELYNEIKKDVQDGKITLTDDQKKQLDDLGESFTRVEQKSEEFKKQRDLHYASLDRTSQANHDLVNELAELRRNGNLKGGETRVLDALDSVFHKYQEILDSAIADKSANGEISQKNEAALAIYGRYMEKVTGFLKDRNLGDVNKLKEFTDEYLGIMNKIGSLDQGASKEEVFADITAYLGDNAAQAELFRGFIFGEETEGGMGMNFVPGGGVGMNSIPNLEINQSGALFNSNFLSPEMSLSSTNQMNYFSSDSDNNFSLARDFSNFPGSGVLALPNNTSRSSFASSMMNFGLNTGFSPMMNFGLNTGFSMMSGMSSNPFGGLSNEDFSSIRNKFSSSMDNLLDDLSSNVSDFMKTGTSMSKAKTSLMDEKINLFDSMAKASSSGGIFSEKMNLFRSNYIKDAAAESKAMFALNEIRRQELKEVTDELIAVADLAEESLDLEVDPSEADMTKLLKKFREIISKLDKDMRNSIKSFLEQNMIDQAIANSERAEEDMKNLLDNLKELSDKMFDGSKEVKVAELSSENKKAVLSGLVQFHSLLA